MDETVGNFTTNIMRDSVESVYTELFENREKEIKETLKYEVDNVALLMVEKQKTNKKWKLI